MKFKKAKITDVNLTRRGFSHSAPPGVDIMLTKDDRRAVVMSDGGTNPAQGEEPEVTRRGKTSGA